MSGTLCGILDAYLYETTQANRNQAIFTMLFNFFERMVGVGNATRVALQYGASGTGTDFFDEANPFGENAFFVYKLLASVSTVRTTDLYVMVQWADTASFGSSPGNPGKINGATTDGVAIVSAFREDGGSPWNGTTNNDGTDVKGATVWVDGGSTLHVLSRSCSDATPNGSYATNKEDMPMIDDFTSNYLRFFAIGDADSILILTSFSASASPAAHTFTYLGIYQARDGLTITNPYVLLALNTALPLINGQIYGSTSGSAAYEGGMLNALPNEKVQQVSPVLIMDILDANVQPNAQISPTELDQMPIFLRTLESYPGIVGQLPTAVCASVQNVAQYTTNADQTRAFIGTTVATQVQISVPWDGGDPPGTGNNRLGRTL